MDKEEETLFMINFVIILSVICWTLILWLLTTQWGWYCYKIPFTEQATEAQRGEKCFLPRFTEKKWWCEPWPPGLLTLAHVVWISCFPPYPLWVIIPTLTLFQDSIVPAPTIPVGAMLYSVQGIFSIPQPLCLLTTASWWQIGLRDQRSRQVRSHSKT